MIFRVEKDLPVSGGLCEGPDTLGAEDLARFSPVLMERYSLQIGAKSTRGRLIRPGPIATKGGFFAAVCTFGHCSYPFDPILGIRWERYSPAS